MSARHRIVGPARVVFIAVIAMAAVSVRAEVAEITVSTNGQALPGS